MARSMPRPRSPSASPQPVFSQPIHILRAPQSSNIPSFSPVTPHNYRWSPGYVSPAVGVSPISAYTYRAYTAAPIPPPHFYAQPRSNVQFDHQGHIYSTPPRQPLRPAQPLSRTFEFIQEDGIPQPTTHAPQKRSRTNDASSANNGRSKRSRQTDENVPNTLAESSRSNIALGAPMQSCAGHEPAVTACGPMRDTEYQGPRSHPVFRSLHAQKQRASAGTSTSSDVWYFVRPVPSRRKADAPVLQPNEPMSTTRPKDAPFLACRLCSGSKWSVWKNGTGQVKNIRTHLRRYHAKVHRELVVAHRLRNWATIDNEIDGESDEFEDPFTWDGFVDQFLRFVAVTDQAVHITDTEELRNLFAFLGAGKLLKKEIPHRDTLIHLIVIKFQERYLAMINDIRSSLGRVSGTTDAWLRANLEGYIAFTVHYMARTKTGRLALRKQLVAFRRIQGSHSGEHLADAVFQILKDLGILGQLGMITTDNASNNITMMDHLAHKLCDAGIDFDRDGNHIRCFPHVVNIPVKTGLKHVGHTVPPEADSEVTRNEIYEIDDAWPEYIIDTDAYRTALQNDPIGAARHLAVACRASGQRREGLQETIKEGNVAKAFGEIDMREVVLLRDVAVRWSSTFLMIDRVLELYPAVEKYAREKNEDLISYLLSPMQTQVLQDIHFYLQVFHDVQELVSADQTPMLSVVIPVYEKLIKILQVLKAVLPQLTPAIAASLNKLEEYLGKSCSTRLYMLAMAINPTCKLEALREQPVDFAQAKKWLEEAMFTFQKASREATTSSNNPSPEREAADIIRVGRRIVRTPSEASRRQGSGLARLNGLHRSISARSITNSTDTERASGNEASTRSSTPVDLDTQDRASVCTEVERWMSSGIITNEEELAEFDLVEYWDAKSSQADFPFIFRVALDVMPIQASSVPCERVFSAAKETDTLRRSNLSPAMFEILQFLKFSYRNDRLSFTDKYLAKEEPLSVIDAEPGLLHKLVTSGELKELEKMIDDSLDYSG